MGNGRPFSLVALAFLAGLGGSWLFSILPGPLRQVSPPLQENAYERVMRTQTLRCGYAVRPPFLIRDLKTGELSGIFHDYVEALARALGLNVAWAEETGWADFPTALENGRVDAFCAGAWTSAARARVIDFVRPVFYEMMHAYVRADDFRFDGDLEKANTAPVKVMSIEGGAGFFISHRLFPKAQHVHLPALTSISENIAGIVAKKADLTVQSPAAAFDFQKANPKTIRKVEVAAPLHMSDVALAIAGGQDRLRAMLSTATNELLLNGGIEAIVAKYPEWPDSILLHPALPYRQKSGQGVKSLP